LTLPQHHILLVDDDPLIILGIGDDLKAAGYRVTTAYNGEQALALLKAGTYDVLITDLVMDAMDGLQLLKEAKTLHPDIMVMILTGYGNLSSAIEAMRHKAEDYLLKPCDPDEIKIRLARCLEKKELQLKLKAYEGILPTCCVCSKIRDDSDSLPGQGEWISFERYLHTRGGITPSSTYCPTCFEKAKEELDRALPSEAKKSTS
jgi:DNA-binding NtrC family response regulator